MSEFAVSWARAERVCTLHSRSKFDSVQKVFSHSIPAVGLDIAGSWRNDNASDLASQLGLQDCAPTALILAHAYRTWGPELSERLRGPFAIAIVDHEAGELFACRDAFGVEPLFVAHNKDSIVIANKPSLARKMASLASIVEPSAVADFLRGAFSSETITYHKGLHRLPRGHWHKWNASTKVSEVSYYDLTRVPMSEPEFDAVAHFRHLFDTEVLACGANADNIGVFLSGGLDSSAIAGSVIDQRTNSLPVHSLSMLYEGEHDWADRPYLDAVRSAYEMSYHGQDFTDNDPVAMIPKALEALDGPTLGVGISNNLAVFEIAKSVGVETLYNGHGGDEVVSYGAGRLNELIKARQWFAFARESKGAARLGQTPLHRFLLFYLQHSSKWQRFRRGISRTAAAVKSREDYQPDNQSSLLNPDLMASLGESRPPISPYSKPEYTEREIHESLLINPSQPHGLETLTLAARANGFDMAMPFYSRDLIEFSLSLPSHWKLRNGFTRFIQRESMKGRVPDTIIRRHDKHIFTKNFVRNVLASEAVQDLTRSPSAGLLEYVNQDHLQELWKKADHDPNSVSGGDARSLWSAASLAIWLDSDRDACLGINN